MNLLNAIESSNYTNLAVLDGMINKSDHWQKGVLYIGPQLKEGSPGWGDVLGDIKKIFRSKTCLKKFQNDTEITASLLSRS